MKKWLAVGIFVILLLSLTVSSCLPERTDDAIPLPDPVEPDENGETVIDDDTEPIPDKDQGTLLVAYEKEGRIMLAIGDGDPSILTSGANDSYPIISPNGRHILYQRTIPPGPANLRRFELRVIDRDGSNDRSLVTTEDLPGEIGETIDEPEPVMLDRLPWRIAWLGDNRQVAFNTILEAGYGVSTYNDLWLVNLQTGAITQLLADGEGGSFAFSPDGNTLIVADERSVSMMNSDGSNRRKMFSFPFVNTASEYAFIPQPVWAPDSSYGLVAIVCPEPFGSAEDPYFTIWRLPRSGEAEVLSIAHGFNIPEAMSGILFSPDGQYFAYIEGVDYEGTMHIARIDGTIVSVLEFAYYFHGWSADSQLIIYATDEPFLAGLDEPHQELDKHDDVFGGMAVYRWVGAITYVGLDWSYFLDASILWATRIDGESWIIDTNVSSFDAVLID